jgi:sucrose-6-phosphate hydrolase SacC (GH32 family)
LIDRRTILAWLGVAGLYPSSAARALASATDPGAAGGWVKFPGNPVLGGEYGTCFDICVLREHNKFRMWLSWRPKKSIALSESSDGMHWSAPQIVLPPNSASVWEDDINRPVVVRREGRYHMWYTGQVPGKGTAQNGRANGKSTIGYTTSSDGIHWQRRTEVLKPELPWEGVALMSPHVLWDENQNQWRMWYSGGEQYEPNAIGHATSRDGLHWIKDPANPVFRADPRNPWEKERVAGCQVIQQNGWFYIFYIGYRDIDHAQIGLARSRDGLSSWERNPANPILRATRSGFDADACYKPYALFAHGKWMLWYNGRNANLEQIGLATRSGRDLGFHW